MSVKLVILTTDTTHHLYFAWKIRERFPVQAILLETQALKAPFDSAHPFEQQRESFERDTLLKGAPKKFEDVAETHQVGSCNDEGGLALLKRLDPDWLLVFGTGLLKPAVIQSAKKGCLNLHGGDPEHYRGLDSHLWTIYHRDFDHLTTTLHFMDENLDTGDIVAQQSLSLKRGMQLFQLRAVNTQACVDLSLAALADITAGKKPNSREQKLKGRYYSFMPSVLKEACLKNFNKHVQTL